jgi:hypothetical protein
MTDKGIVTANLLNELILNLDKMTIGEDIFLGLEEFSLGLPAASREIDLCWGFAKSEPSTTALASHEVTIGKGVTRNSTGDLDSVQFDFTSLDLTTLLPSAITLSNIYAFGSIYMTPSVTVGNPPDLESALVKGVAGGVNLFMTNDLSLETIFNMMQVEEVPAAEKPESNSLEIYKFLLNINYYNSLSPELKDVEIYFFDKRIPRGWGGFADEFMAANITSYVVFKKEDYTDYLDTIQQSVYNIVKNWINLRSWSPNFLDYWGANSASMPDRLRDYLELEFSLII